MLSGIDLSLATTPGQFTPVILIVSGAAERQTRLRTILAAQGHAAEAADDAGGAFQFVREREPDIVIVDRIVEGEVSAADICSTIKADPLLQATQIILVTEANSSEEWNRSIRARADSCVSERFDPDEIAIHLKKVIQTRTIYRQMRGLNDKLQNMFLELGKLNKEKERDLREGGVFQKSIFPDQEQINETMSALNIQSSLFYRPFPDAEVSGDFWDVFPFAARTVGFLLADAVGHGIPAALYSLYTVSALRRMIRSPGIDYFHRLSEELFRIMDGKPLAAGFCTFEGDRLSFFNAGLPAPIHIRGADARSIEHYGPVLGAFHPAPRYEALEMDFLPGDSLILCTDGIIEARNRDGEEFGPERLLDACLAAAMTSATGIARRIRDDVAEFLGDVRSADDTTVVVFRREV